MKPKPEYNQKISTMIQRLGINGEGVGHWHGYTVFVDGALPGEVAHSRVKERKKNYGRGELISVENPSPSRVSPVCPLFGKCGGCQLMHYDYAAQLEMKRQRVIDALERIGKCENAEVLPCVASPSPLAYRNKIQVPIRNGEEGLRIGFNQRHSHDLVDVDYCHIHGELGQSVYEKIVGILKASRLRAYDVNTQEGELRYLIIKTAVHTNQALAVLVTYGPATEDLRNCAKKIVELCPEVKGVVQSVNTADGNVVLGGAFHVLEGQGYIEERICGLAFKVSPASFFQINPLQAENLYRAVLDFAELSGKETVLDAFCGVGTLSLILSGHAAHVTGVECVPQAIEDAVENAKNNGIAHVRFVCSEVEKFIQGAGRYDVAVVNPPRKGCEPSFLDKLGELSPEKVIYVSCDPATLARDLARLREFGYSLSKVKPFDMFPQTAHVETVAQLVHRRASPL